MTSDVGTRAVARVIGLDELVRSTWQGRVRVPQFSRAFSWSRADVIRLVDSVLRGFPIGSLLLWERPAEAGRITLGALVVDAPAFDSALWVVDGQQRIVSLANALHPRGGADDRFALGYDVRAQEVRPRPKSDDPFVVPLPALFDLPGLLDWFADRPEALEHRDPLLDAARNLQRFAVPAYQVVEDDPQVVQLIFERLNSTGKALTRAEIFSALHISDSGTAGTGLDVDRIAAEIDQRFGFGPVDGDTVVTCLLARRGPDVQRDIRGEFDPARGRGVVDFAHETRQEAFRRGATALEQAVEFLVDAGVPHYTFLPHRYLLAVLTRFFALHPAPRPQERRLLGRWFWRAATTGSGMDKGGAAGTTRVFCRSIAGDDAYASLQRLLAAVGHDAARLPHPHRFKLNLPEGKLVLCSWWHRQPRRPDTGEEYTRADIAAAVEDAATATDAVRWIFPVRFTHTLERRWAADRVLMPVLDDPVGEVSGLLQQRPRGVPPDLWPDVLASHLVTPESERLLQAEDVVGFIERRHRDVVAHLTSFLSLKCEWGFENTPPLEDLDLDDLDDADAGF